MNLDNENRKRLIKNNLMFNNLTKDQEYQIMHRPLEFSHKLDKDFIFWVAEPEVKLLKSYLKGNLYVKVGAIPMPKEFYYQLRR